MLLVGGPYLEPRDGRPLLRFDLTGKEPENPVLDAAGLRQGWLWQAFGT